MSRKRQLIILVTILLITGAGAAIYLFMHNRASPVPKAIQKQISFVILIPPKAEGGIDNKSVKYDAGKGILSFSSSYGGATLVVSEQSFPDQFVDVPQAYDQFLNQLPTITSFDSTNGQVNIAEPPNLNGMDLIVANIKGTFIFVRPDKNLSENDWRSYFNSLAVN